MTDRYLRFGRFAAGTIAAVACGSAVVIDSVRGTTRMGMPASVSQIAAETPEAGIRFACGGDFASMAAARRQMDSYLMEEDIPAAWVVLRTRNGSLTYTLNTPANDTSTLDFVRRKEMELRDAAVELPTAVAGRTRTVHTVSPKEILLALLQRGRLTAFDCSVDALREHVGIRRNIVAWTEELNWVWPDGDTAKWNARYWRRGTPHSRRPLHEAVNDAFMAQDRYRIGCYTAIKLVILQGVLDYHRRVVPNAEKLRRIEARLAADGEPLVGVEPGAMWFFEADYAPADGERPGKLVELLHGIAADNFVPGDWAYLLNTDAASYGKTGYEGSNMIYLGRDRFSDYYNDHGHAYSFRQKLNEVYQWRHGVFSRSRDAAKVRPLSERELLALTATPERGGLLLSYRGAVSLGQAAPR